MGSRMRERAGSQRMKKKQKRLLVQLIVGAVVILAVMLGSIWSHYREYCDKMAIMAEVIRTEGKTEDILFTIKGTKKISDRETQKVLQEYGYNSMESSEYGRQFCLKSAVTGAGGLMLYAAYAAVLLYERRKSKKEQEEEWLKLVRYLEEIRGGNYKPDYYDDYLEEEGYSRLVLDQLDSLCEYLDLVTTQARQEKEEIKALVTDISHQLKTPVAALNSCFVILQKETLTKEEKREFEMRLASQLEGLEQLIKTLVNVSKLEMGLIEIRLKKARIFDTVLEAVNRILEKAEAKDMEIELDGDEGIEELVIWHDRKWLCEALINVLENAVKYSPKGTTISIRVKKWTSFLRLEIQDEGIGIPAKEYHKIFQRFYRGERTEVQKEEGQGIGLYLTRKIISGHHGTITVGAGQIKKGRGSMFVIQLPYEQAESLTEL